MSSIFKIFIRETFLLPTFFILLSTKIPKRIQIKKYLTWSSILRDNQPGTNQGPKSSLIFLFRYWRYQVYSKFSLENPFWSHFFFIWSSTKIPKSIKIKNIFELINILRDNQPRTNSGPKSSIIFLFPYWRCQGNFNILSLQKRFRPQSYLVLIAIFKQRRLSRVYANAQARLSFRWLH